MMTFGQKLSRARRALRGEALPQTHSRLLRRGQRNPARRAAGYDTHGTALELETDTLDPRYEHLWSGAQYLGRLFDAGDLWFAVPPSGTNWDQFGSQSAAVQFLVADRGVANPRSAREQLRFIRRLGRLAGAKRLPYEREAEATLGFHPTLDSWAVLQAFGAGYREGLDEVGETVGRVRSGSESGSESGPMELWATQRLGAA